MNARTEVDIVALTRGGSQLGERLQNRLADSILYVPAKFLPELGGAPRTFPYEDLRSLVGRLFVPDRGLVFIMATGIVVRLISPHLKGKRQDPGVVVLDEEGRYAISLLSGHWGGGNALADEVASLIGARAVISTASDVLGIPAVEMLARELNCVIEDPSQVKRINAALVNGEEVALYGTSCHERLAELCRSTSHLMLCPDWNSFLRTSATAYVLLTNRELSYSSLTDRAAVCLLRPRNLVVGIGCRRGATVEEIESVVFSGLREGGFSPLSIREIATIQGKEDEEGLVELARRHGLPVRYHSPEALNGVGGLSCSEKVQTLMGVKGVCEPAALLSAPGGRLVLPKRKAGRVTLAVAEVDFT